LTGIPKLEFRNNGKKVFWKKLDKYPDNIGKHPVSEIRYEEK